MNGQEINLISKDDVIVLRAEGRCFNTQITFFKDKFNEQKYQEYIDEFKRDIKIHKLIRKENDEEIIIFER